MEWDEALDDIAARVRAALQAGRKDAVMYHVGRPGEDLFTERVLQTWGVDGHNSHTNICSSGARVGYAAWMGIDRPAPDHAHARFILLLSSHLEAGHYFNPHAQRIMEAKEAGTRMAVVDPRLSNTAAAADYWLSPWPGTEAGMLLALAHVLVDEGLVNTGFVRRWVNWRQLMADEAYLERLVEEGRLPQAPPAEGFEGFLWLLRELYRPYTPEWAAGECGVEPGVLRAVAREIGRAGTAFASHVWRGASAGHLGGWMVARNLFFLHVLTGSVGTRGGCLPNASAKFVPRPPSHPYPPSVWNEVAWPREYPLAHFEVSFLLPHLLERQDQRIDVYFTRVYNPVWTNPDGFSWIEMLTSDRIGLHVALTPTWSETAQYADYVLPMGLAPERHDLHSYETHAARWIGFRQPVRRVAMERLGRVPADTREANPGEVWEENEFWIELSWRIDPDGSLGIRRHHESPYRLGEKIRIDEYYRWIFENSVPGLPEAARREGLEPLEYMRRHGAFQLDAEVYEEHARPVPPEVLEGARVSEDGGVYVEDPPPKENFRPYPGPFLDEAGRTRVGVMVEGQAVMGFPTPSGLLEFYSTTLKEWGWPEYALPVYPLDEAGRQRMPEITSQVHHARIRWEASEMILLPTFRLPTLIHTRTNGAKWLYETAHHNPVWIHPRDAARIGVQTGDLVRVETEIGHLVDRVWVTEAIRPGVVACSHHLGRWRLNEESGSDRWNSALVRLDREGSRWRMDQVHGATPFDSADPDSRRIWWREAGVHQNLIFPVQPDPISGAHCWHVRVRVTRAAASDRYGEVAVDTARSRAAFQRWLKLTRPGPGPDGTRRPYWLMRPLKPSREAYQMLPEAVPRPAGRP
ncbi:molybdopterin dinucleotide binding domain-containing protein [Limnochorda pilosa]|uniref:Formate dehydrogenase n=1 Tax=Limnochorda pilosa TaxID=1555112 RepID=A0A0K2SQF1_LIMPI|nr:molybdopterin dinucleotide binding domain-containing protein [Limnochorda pilosa]BAS29222.1 formate dehydrogenase [Limnochorda pilosa]